MLSTTCHFYTANNSLRLEPLQAVCLDGPLKFILPLRENILIPKLQLLQSLIIIMMIGMHQRQTTAVTGVRGCALNTKLTKTPQRGRWTASDPQWHCVIRTNGWWNMHTTSHPRCNVIIRLNNWRIVLMSWQRQAPSGHVDCCMALLLLLLLLLLSYQNRTRPTELPSCSTNRLELSAGTPTLDTDQSQTV